MHQCAYRETCIRSDGAPQPSQAHAQAQAQGHTQAQAQARARMRTDANALVYMNMRTTHDACLLVIDASLSASK
eukprot:9351450-Alexandrium_andersonii.AAC.1